MKILIIKFRNIGDVLLSTPLIENLKLLLPDSIIDVAINKESKDILKDNPNINKIHLYDRNLIKNQKPINKILSETKFIKNILSEKYDIVISLTEGDRGSIIALLTKAKYRYGYLPKNRLLKLFKPFTKYKYTFERKHAVQRDLDFLNFLKLSPLEKKVKIYFSKNDLKKIEKYRKNFIIIHPVTKWQYKYWENDRFAKVVDFLIEKGERVIITGSKNPKELDVINKIIKLSKYSPINLAGKLSLTEIAALYSKAKLFIGLDTAPMHIAAAMDIPVITLFGLSDPIVWGPWENELQKICYKDIRTTQHCGKHTIIQHPGEKIIYQNSVKKSEAMLKISTEEVIEEIKKKI